MRKRLIVAIAISAALLASACAGSSGGSTAVPPANAVTAAKGVTTVTFWHSMSGPTADALNTLISRFNAAHKGKIVVKPVFEGAYDDAITKYKASVLSHSTPSLMMVYDVGTRFMVDSGQVVPMQKFIDRDHYSVADLEPNITGYYSIGKTLYSMPFNTSMPLLYYNKTMFKQAGLDPDKPPTTLAEIRADALKLKNSKHSGFGAAIYGWYVEQYDASSGVSYCNNGNGRAAQATRVEYDQPANEQLYSWWAKMVKDGLAVNTGRQTPAAQAAFEAQRMAITLESTGTLATFEAAAKVGHFQLGVGYFPKPKGSKSGPIIGGASLWIDGPGHSAAEKEASWELVKFLSSAKSQAYWHTHTGYFPINKAALQEPADVAYRKEYPAFDTAVRQLQQTKISTATLGCSMGVMPQARQSAEDALEQTILGESSARSALQHAADLIKQKIVGYNDATK